MMEEKFIVDKREIMAGGRDSQESPEWTGLSWAMWGDWEGKRDGREGTRCSSHEVQRYKKGWETKMSVSDRGAPLGEEEPSLWTGKFRIEA